jgi:hypothetical protein
MLPQGETAMKKKTKGGGTVIKGNIHNPKFPLGLPGERNGMAKANKKKNKAKNKSGGRKNSASVKKAASHANASTSAITRAVNQALANTKKKKKKGGGRRNSASSWKNGFTFKGLNAMDLGVGALSLIVTQALAQVLSPWVAQTSYLGIGVQVGMAAGVFAIAPANMRNAATLGAGITPVASLINRLTNNAIGTTIVQTARGFLPAPATQAPATNGQQGIAGIPRRVVRMY